MASVLAAHNSGIYVACITVACQRVTEPAVLVATAAAVVLALVCAWRRQSPSQLGVTGFARLLVSALLIFFVLSAALAVLGVLARHVGVSAMASKEIYRSERGDIKK